MYCGIRSHQDTDMSDVVVPTTDDVSNSFANMNSSFHPREVMLLQLTLIKMMVAKAESQEIEFNMRQKYCEIFVLLLKEAKIDSKLICLLSSYDQLLSHMASKSLASLVYFQLKEENALNVSWLTFSVKTLSGFPVSTQVAECLWTLTTIIKDILKEKASLKAGILKKLLAPLDAVLEGFYNSILFHHFDSHHYTSPYSEAANNLIGFIDLLEALLASRIELELPLGCQRVLFLKVSYVLNIISSSVHYLIKKKSIMLLKKCVLYKSREDAKSGSLFLQTPSLYEDTLALSNAVLQVVNLTWLNHIPLSEKASYFGGSEAAPGDDTRGVSDQTVLRALSLIVLKALEFKFQNSATEAEIKDFQSSMSQLLIFWRSHLKSFPQSRSVVHHCEWLSLIFIEQDDDMWEAAKALLLIYLQLDRLRDMTHYLGVLSLFMQDTEQISLFPKLIFISNLDDGIKCTLMKFVDDTKLSGEVDTLEGITPLQEDLERLEEWANKNLMKFSKDRRKILHLGRHNPGVQHKLGSTWLESSSGGHGEQQAQYE
ncbi:protein Lines 1 [Grus japonensis]|uniref:Protein Lines 1 n=1 Tax=Grus japonensis TaxID=30415 RepID=A0ABC9XBV1_GRUJA